MTDNPRIVAVSDDDFAEKVLNAAGVVVVDFWAPWCDPCLQIKPFLPKLEMDFRGKATLFTYNRDLHRKMFDELALSGIPNVVAFKSGEIIGSVIGGRPYKEFREAYVEMLADHVQPRQINPGFEEFFEECMLELSQELDELLKDKDKAAIAQSEHDSILAEITAAIEESADEIYDQPAATTDESAPATPAGSPDDAATG
jgi:thioredoxin 1